MVYRIRKGLNIPISGEPEQQIHPGASVKSVAVIGDDYLGFRRLPRLLIKEGQRVVLGQALTCEKSYPEVITTAPGSGIITQIQRGKKRFLHAITILLDGDDEETFNKYSVDELPSLSKNQVTQNLLQSGLWVSIRTRPFSLTAVPYNDPFAIYITAIDTNPLAPDPAVIIQESAQDFINGITLIQNLTSGKVYVCVQQGTAIELPEHASIERSEFYGPHPAGLVGTHIHFQTPVGLDRTVWHLNYQDVIAIGKLFTSGRLPIDRIISIAGPSTRRPRLIRTRLGAAIDDLLQGELKSGDCRVISGSILSGRRAVGWWSYLGRFHNQISILQETNSRELFGWLLPGLNKYSAGKTFLSALASKSKRYALTSALNGSPRAMVPIGSYEKIMPLDILPTQLLRALLVGDTQMSCDLGCLELDEEDLALCSFVCPSKHEFGPILRQTLDQIRRELE